MARKYTTLAGLRSLRGYSQSHSLADELDYLSGGKKGMAEKKLKEARELSDKAKANNNSYDHYEARVKLRDARALLAGARHPDYDALAKEIKEREDVHTKAYDAHLDRLEAEDKAASSGKASGLKAWASPTEEVAAPKGAVAIRKAAVDAAHAATEDALKNMYSKGGVHDRAADAHTEAASKMTGKTQAEAKAYHEKMADLHTMAGNTPNRDKINAAVAQIQEAYAARTGASAPAAGFEPLKRVTDTKQSDYEAAKAKAEGHSAKGEHKEAHAAHNAAANVARSLGDSAAAQMHQDKADEHLMASAATSGKVDQLKAFAEKVAPTATASVVNVASGGGKAPEGGHKELSAAARALTKGIKATGEGDHGAAAEAHGKAAAAHRAKADAHKAAGNKLAANAHIASATVHERAAAEHQLQVGARGGTYYVSDSGQKVYTKK